VQAQLEEHHVQVNINLRPGLPKTQADANQIQQVLVNLLLNANDAIGENGGSIDVATNFAETAKDPEQMKALEIAVKDTGCGIKTDDLQKIFDPFFSTKGPKGTGLGLAVAWGIVEKHNGKIEVESEVGRGTTFRIILPIV